MVKRKILKVGNPIANCYSKLGAVFSILQPHEETLPWLYYNYTHFLFFYNESTGLSWVDLCNAAFPIQIHEWIACPFLKCNTYSYDDFAKENILELFTDFIDDGRFIYLSLNRKYLKKLNEIEDFIHDTLIKGYDLEERQFLCQDFYNGKYSEKWFPVHEVIEAFKNNSTKPDEDSLGEVFTLKYHDPIRFPYNETVKIKEEVVKNNIKRICDNVEIPGSEVLITNGTECVPDLLVYDKLADNLISGACSLKDIRPFYAIRTHVRLLEAQTTYWKLGDHKKIEMLIHNTELMCYQCLSLYLRAIREERKINVIGIANHLHQIKELERNFINTI